MKKQFHLDLLVKEHLKKNTIQLFNGENEEDYSEFYTICESVDSFIQSEWNGKDQRFLEQHKNAILGHEKEVNYFIERIEEYLSKNHKQYVLYPKWYPGLAEGVFHERYGLAGVHQWKTLEETTSCKIIGERVYYLINGKQQQQEQTFSKERLHQLKSALLLGDINQGHNEDYHQLYMVDGTRIEIFNKVKQTAIVFRKYVVQTFTFEEQSRRNTIDSLSIPFLESMVKCGFNVSFTGPVRTGKTTFLATYQSYEDTTLEGVQIETDPEIPWHIIMPKAPIIQLLADGEELRHVIKPIMRSDGDYLIMAEARDGLALSVAVEITRKGTRRVKMTYHTGNAVNYCFDVAQMISKQVGGDVWANMLQVAEGFHYIFAFQQMAYDRSKKKLKGIYEIRFNSETLLISTHQICKYEPELDDWTYNYDIGEQISEIGNEEDPLAFEIFRNELKKLSEAKPMKGKNAFVSPYSRLMTQNISGGK